MSKEKKNKDRDDDNFEILKYFTKRYRIFNSERILSESELEENDKNKNNN